MTRDDERDEVMRRILARRDTECRVIRIDTLGYQKCGLPKGHTGQHKSQDGKTYDETGVDRA